jgi:Domain of unknown function (DUF4402)
VAARRSRRLRSGRLATAACLLLAAAGAPAQQITLSNTRPLDFGRFAAGGGGSVTVSPSGARSSSGGVVLLHSPAAGAAVFNLGQGADGKAVVLTLPVDGSIRLSSGGDSMPVHAFVSSPAVILTVPAGGLTVSVGATMTVAPNQARGNYSGSFPLIVNYQ